MVQSEGSDQPSGIVAPTLAGSFFSPSSPSAASSVGSSRCDRQSTGCDTGSLNMGASRAGSGDDEEVEASFDVDRDRKVEKKNTGERVLGSWLCGAVVEAASQYPNA